MNSFFHFKKCQLSRYDKEEKSLIKQMQVLKSAEVFQHN